jgi:hypothetical protein
VLAGAAGFEPANAGTKITGALLPFSRKPQKSADFWTKPIDFEVKKKSVDKLCPDLVSLSPATRRLQAPKMLVL